MNLSQAAVVEMVRLVLDSGVEPVAVAGPLVDLIAISFPYDTRLQNAQLAAAWARKELGAAGVEIADTICKLYGLDFDQCADWERA